MRSTGRLFISTSTYLRPRAPKITPKKSGGAGPPRVWKTRRVFEKARPARVYSGFFNKTWKNPGFLIKPGFFQNKNCFTLWNEKKVTHSVFRRYLLIFVEILQTESKILKGPGVDDLHSPCLMSTSSSSSRNTTMAILVNPDYSSLVGPFEKGT